MEKRPRETVVTVERRPVFGSVELPTPSGYRPLEASGFPSVGRPRPLREVVEIPRKEGSYGVIADFDQTIAPAHDGSPIPRPFPGIAALIHCLQGSQIDRAPNRGYTHYVTARSPELTAPIPAYLAQHGLPNPKNLHIGTANERDEQKVKEKVENIARIFERDPGRGFVLLGDSSHIDPIVYRVVQAKFPKQVVAAIIHRVKDNVPAGGYEGLIVVDDYADAALALHAAGVLGKASAQGIIECAELEGLSLRAAQKHQLEALRHR